MLLTNGIVVYYILKSHFLYKSRIPKKNWVGKVPYKNNTVYSLVKVSSVNSDRTGSIKITRSRAIGTKIRKEMNLPLFKYTPQSLKSPFP